MSCLPPVNREPVASLPGLFLLGVTEGQQGAPCGPPAPAFSAVASQRASLLRLQNYFSTLKPKGPPRRPWGPQTPKRQNQGKKTKRGEAACMRRRQPSCARRGLRPRSYLLRTVWDLLGAGQRPYTLHGQHVLQQLLTPCTQTDRQTVEGQSLLLAWQLCFRAAGRQTA